MAISEVTTTLGPFLSWMFLPSLATNLVLQFLYKGRILTLPSSAAQSQAHTNRIRTLVIVSYLLCTIYKSLYEKPTNFYELLQLPLDCDTETVRRSFRRLARIYHPDKMGGGAKDERLFIDLRRAHDCLVEPVRRAAYNRFGETVLTWSNAITMKDFYTQGIKDSLTFYIVNPTFFAFVHWINGQKMLSFWQFTLLSILLSTEIYLILSADRPNLWFFLPPQLTQRDLINALRTTYLAIYLASNHLSSLLPTPYGELAKWADKDPASTQTALIGLKEAMTSLEEQWKAAQVEADRSFAYSLLPLQPSASTTMQSATTPDTLPPSTSEKDHTYAGNWLDLFAKAILRLRLKSIPALQTLASTTPGPITTEQQVSADDEIKDTS